MLFRSVPPPEECENDEDMYRRLIRDKTKSPEKVKHYTEMLVVSTLNTLFCLSVEIPLGTRM